MYLLCCEPGRSRPLYARRINSWDPKDSLRLALRLQHACVGVHAQCTHACTRASERTNGHACGLAGMGTLLLKRASAFAVLWRHSCVRACMVRHGAAPHVAWHGAVWARAAWCHKCVRNCIDQKKTPERALIGPMHNHMPNHNVRPPCRCAQYISATRCPVASRGSCPTSVFAPEYRHVFRHVYRYAYRHVHRHK